MLCDEWNHRSHELGEDFEAVIESMERIALAIPETTTRATHVPIGEIIDKCRKQAPCLLRVKGGVSLVDARDERIELRVNPLIHGVLGLSVATREREVSGVGIESKEGDGVPIGEQRLSNNIR